MSCLRRLIDIIKWHNRELPQVHAFVAVFLSGSFGQRDCSRLSYLGRPARGTRTGVPHCGPLNKAGALDAQCRQRVYTANKASAAWSITLYTYTLQPAPPGARRPHARAQERYGSVPADWRLIRRPHVHASPHCQWPRAPTRCAPPIQSPQSTCVCQTAAPTCALLPLDLAAP